MPTVLKTLSNGGIDLRGGLGPLLVAGVEAAASKLQSRFNSQQGQWKFNLEWSPDYVPILGRFFNPTESASILADEAGAPIGIAPVPPSSVSFSEDPLTRALSATISPVQTVEGEDFDLVVTIPGS